MLSDQWLGGGATALQSWELFELCESTSLLGLWPPMTLDVLIPSALDITGDLQEALLDIQEAIFCDVFIPRIRPWLKWLGRCFALFHTHTHTNIRLFSKADHDHILQKKGWSLGDYIYTDFDMYLYHHNLSECLFLLSHWIFIKTDVATLAAAVTDCSRPGPIASPCRVKVASLEVWPRESLGDAAADATQVMRRRFSTKIMRTRSLYLYFLYFICNYSSSLCDFIRVLWQLTIFHKWPQFFTKHFNHGKSGMQGGNDLKTQLAAR